MSYKIDFTTFSGNYSTSEIDTGYTWIDGKHIYKKSFSLTTSSSAVTTTFNHNISNFGTLIKVEGAFSPRNGIWEPLFRPTNSFNWFNGISDVRDGTTSEPNTFKFEVGGDVDKNRPLYVTLYYTKSS